MFSDFKFEDFLTKLKGGDIKTIAITSITLLCLALSYLIVTGNGDTSTAEKTTEAEEEKEEIVLRDFTIEQLRDFDGKGEQPIYIALKGDIFDVSSAKEFYGEGSGYNCFAGRDATRAMAKLSFEEIDLSNSNVDDLGSFELGILEDWYIKFKDYKCYPIMGRVSKPIAFKDYTLTELLEFKDVAVVPEGRLDAPIFMGINGKVIDVSYGGKEMYGKGGPYFLFAGIDASKALAKMSFKPEDLESRDLSDLTPVQQKTLADWEKKFIIQRKYPVVGNILV
jgi:membrane-associated progesterone receptor component